MDIAGRCSRCGEGVGCPRENAPGLGVTCRCEDVRDGGLKGRGDERSDNGVFVDSSRDPEAFTVEDEEDEVPDSRTAVSPWLDDSRPRPLLVSRATGGRLRPGVARTGLFCLGGATRTGTLYGVETPGDCEDMDVGVDVRLKAPGDSERRADDSLSCA